MMMNEEAKTEVIRRHCAAVIKMLLGGKPMDSGTAVCGGTPMNFDARLSTASMASEANTDVVHLAFADKPDGTYGLTEITTVLPRDRISLIATDCRLWISRSGARAVIVPNSSVRGHFRMIPSELIHIDGKPANLEAGYARAEAMLAKLTRSRVDLRGQAELHDLARAA